MPPKKRAKKGLGSDGTPISREQVWCSCGCGQLVHPTTERLHRKGKAAPHVRGSAAEVFAIVGKPVRTSKKRRQYELDEEDEELNALGSSSGTSDCKLCLVGFLFISLYTPTSQNYRSHGFAHTIINIESLRVKHKLSK